MSTRAGSSLERFNALRGALPDATFVKAHGIIERLRAVKSPRELDALREAGRIAMAGMQAAIAAVLNTDPRTVQMHGR